MGSSYRGTPKRCSSKAPPVSAEFQVEPNSIVARADPMERIASIGVPPLGSFWYSAQTGPSRVSE